MRKRPNKKIRYKPTTLLKKKCIYKKIQIQDVKNITLENLRNIINFFRRKSKTYYKKQHFQIRFKKS